MPLEGRAWENRLRAATPLREVIPSPLGATREMEVAMATKQKTIKCPLCGDTFQDASQALAHRLVAHPAEEPSRRKRIRRARRALARVHRRLEGMGLDEVQAHQVVQALAEELRKAGIT